MADKHGTYRGEPLRGTAQSDTIWAYAGDDTVWAYGGNDHINGGLGDDHIYGGTGTDRVHYSNASGSVTVDLRSGISTGADGNDRLYSIEDVTGSDLSDSIIGNHLANTLYGAGGADIISGEGSADWIEGGGGSDLLWAGVAFDQDGSSDYSVNKLFGWSGDDYIYGGDGHDWLYGNTGNDTLRGNGGGDRLFGGDGSDTVDYLFAPSSVIADLSAGDASGGDSLDLIRDVENVRGSQHDDDLIGDSGRNRIHGDSGNDFIDGSAGGDWLYGDDGDDVIQGEEGADVMVGGRGVDTLIGGRSGGDTFIFYDKDTGDVLQHQADTVSGFGFGDEILIPRGLTYSGSHNSPGDGEFTVWQQSYDRYVVSWFDEGYRDIVVLGFDPTEYISSETVLLF